MKYKLELFLDNLKNKIRYSDGGSKRNWKNGFKKSAFFGGGVLVVLLFVFLGLRSCSGKNGSISKKEYENTVKLAEMYADKNEFDRALSLLDKLLIDNPKDKKILDLFDRTMAKKKEYEVLSSSDSERIYESREIQSVNPNISVDIDTSELSSAMQSALEKQSRENQKALEKALAEQNRQSAENQKSLERALEEQSRQNQKNQKALQESQKAMADLMEKQAANEEALRQKEAERREAEKAQEEQRKKEEEKRKKAEEELAKKNAKLKSEIELVNEKVRMGKASLAAGNYDEAMSYFNEAKSHLPVSAGEPEFSASKDSEMAQAIFDAAEKEGLSKSERAKLMSQAVSLAENAIKSNPKDAAAHNILGSDAFDKKDYNKALEEFKKAVLYDSNNYLSFYNLGKTQYIMKKYSEAVQSFSTSCRLNGTFSSSRYNLGLAQLKLKNDSQALDSFRKAIDINPRYEKAYLEQARILSRRKDFAGACSSYEKVVEINNANTSALMEMGSAYYENGKLSKAEDSYLRALALMQPSANYTLTCFNLSTVLFEDSKYRDAVSYASKAYEGVSQISDDKFKANIIYNYALLLEKTGDLDKAITTYSEVLKYDPNHNKTKINLGVMYMDFDPPDAVHAKALFQSVYDSDNKNFEANNNLGSAYLVLEDFKNSIKHFQNALKLDPKNNEVRLNLAKAYVKDSDYANAKTVYLELLKLTPENWDAYLELSKVCLQAGDNEGAEKYLIYLQSKKPDYKKAEVESLLDGLDI